MDRQNVPTQQATTPDGPPASGAVEELATEAETLALEPSKSSTLPDLSHAPAEPLTVAEPGTPPAAPGPDATQFATDVGPAVPEPADLPETQADTGMPEKVAVSLAATLEATVDAPAQGRAAGGPPGDGPTIALGPSPGPRAGGNGAAATSSHIRYRTIRPHARGGLGEVFVAIDEELGREVALKEIQGRHADRPESRTRFLIEAEVTGGLEHPGIVPVYGLGSYPDGRPYYAMRFIRGRTFKEAIDAFHEAEAKDPGRDPGERALELRELLNRLIDVCNAMAYAHTRGILHRDIKPANVMLGAFGETLVVDWGLAKMLDRPETLGESDLRPLKPLSAGHSGGSATLYGSTVGTPHYMSPEQAAGELDLLGPASDVYSLGATLYYLLVGRPPFLEPQLSLLLHKVRQGLFPRPREVSRKVPPALEAICLKAMALRPEDRYATTRDLAADLERWLADEPVSVYREPWTVRLARWARRHRTLVTTSAALVLAALVALAIGTVLIKREQARTEANFQLAREAVDEMLTRLGEVELADIPQMEPVRRRMLGRALDFYTTFLKQRGDDRSIRRETGRAYTRLGDIEEMLGDYEAAEPAYNRGVALLTALSAERPAVAAYRRDLADARHNLGVLLKKSNRFHEAEQALREARQLRARVVAESPNDPDARRDEMDSVYQLGTVLARLGRVKEVEAAYAEAVDAEQKLAAENPDRTDYPRKLGRYLNNRGILLRSTSKDPRPAEAAFREALDLQRPLADRSPSVAGLQWERARTTSNLAASLEATQGVEQAVPVYRDALARFKRLADDFPSVPDYQNELAVVSSNLGMALYKMGKRAGDNKEIVGRLNAEADGLLAEASAIYRRLIQPGHFPHRPDYRLKLALADRSRGIFLFNVGRGADAEAAFRGSIATLESLVKGYRQVPEYHSALGTVLQNLASNPLFKDEKWDEARRLLDESIAHQRIALEVFPKDPYYQDYVLFAYQNLESILKPLGDHAGAAGAAEAVARLFPNDPRADVRAARLLDLASRLAAGDARLPASQRDEQARALADAALKHLRKAVREKASLYPKDLDSPAFDAIRKRFPDALEPLKKALEARANPPVG